VEAAARGVEVECGVLGLLAGERNRQAAQASVPGEITYESEFYDFAAKYESGGMELLIPARISQTAAMRVRELALEAFARAGCAGLARVDFFVEGEEVLLNELNTMPGFTPTSVYAKLMGASGVAYAELVDRLCRLGIERQARQAAHAF
jgi:D-alanine-D-alanine ligase